MTPIQRLAAELRRAEMFMTGATDYERVRVQGGEHSTVPTDGSIFGWYNDRIERLAMALKRDNDAWQHGEDYVPDTARVAALRKRIRDYEGRDNVWVAFVERLSADTVRKLRKDAGLDNFGVRAERPITAPAYESLRQLAAIPTTETNDALPERAADAAGGGEAPRRDPSQQS